MMDYEGIVRASARAHAPKNRAPGAMGVVPATPSAGGPRQPQQQQQQGSSAPQPQFLGGACYPTPMGMR